MNGYRYDPKEFEYSPHLYGEMSDFYAALEKYKREKTESNEFRLDKQRRDLFFSIKHRVVEGSFPEYRAEEMRDYFWELFDSAVSRQ